MTLRKHSIEFRQSLIKTFSGSKRGVFKVYSDCFQPQTPSFQVVDFSFRIRMHHSFRNQVPDCNFSELFSGKFHKYRIFLYETTAATKFINKLLTMTTIPRGKYTLQLKPYLQICKSPKKKLSYFIFPFF